MRITLLRHGSPDFEWQRKVRGSEFKVLEQEYDNATINDRPPMDSVEQASHHLFVVCSDLNRSVDSAAALGVERIDLSERLFREMNLPYFDKVSVKLPLEIWVIVLRTLWFMGFSKNSESYRAARSRAKVAAERLIELASEHRSVLLVGHGFINHYIAKELVGKGWIGPSSPGRKYWEYGTYELRFATE
ncbi:MAG: histidine phosphatase family protein [Candidatus Thiodiazotropha taylori]